MVKISKKELKGLIEKILESKLEEMPKKAKSFLKQVKKVSDDVIDSTKGSGEDKEKTAKLPKDAQNFINKAKAAADDVKKTASGKTKSPVREELEETEDLEEKVVKDEKAAAHNQKAKDAQEAEKKTRMEKEKKELEDALAKQRNLRKEENEEIEEGAFDANHYCVHHGGVSHNGSVSMAEAVQHVAPDANGFISHYDMKLADGTILENVAAEDIQVTNASLAEEHSMKRDDHKPYKKKMEENEELEEGEVSDEVKARTEPKDKANKADFLPKSARDKINKKNESKIQTPEQEQKLYESRFNKRNEEIFDKLKKLWTK